MYNVQLISIKNIYWNLIFYIKNIFHYALFNTFPYVSLQYRVMSFIIYILAILSACTKIATSNLTVKIKVQRIFVVMFLLISLLFSSEFIYFISPVKTHFYRLEFISGFQMSFLSLLICYRYGKAYIKSFIFILLIFIINTGIMSLFCMQKDFLMIKRAEFQIQRIILNKIVNSPDFDSDIEYQYVQIGQYDSFGKNLYSYNEYSEKESELLYNIITKNNNSLYLRQLGRVSGLFNIDCDDYDSNNIKLLEEKMDKTVYNWIIKTADVFPNVNSIFIKDNKIYIVMNEEVFLNLKQDIINKKLAE